MEVRAAPRSMVPEMLTACPPVWRRPAQVGARPLSFAWLGIREEERAAIALIPSCVPHAFFHDVYRHTQWHRISVAPSHTEPEHTHVLDF